MPLYLEELTKTVLESGQVVLAGERYVAAAHVGTIEVPASLRDSLTARFDRVPEVKTLAQIGAAIGREFGYPLLAAVAPFEPGRLDDALAQFVESGLAFRRGTAHAAVYTFKHALVQDAAYDSLLKTRRQELHRQIAEALERLAPAAKATEPELFARHYAAAGQYDVALPLWYQAGKLAMQRTAAREAVSHLDAALALVQKLVSSSSRDMQELDIRVALGASWILLGGWQAPEVRIALEPALPLAHALERHDALIPIYYGLWATLIGQGRLREAMPWIEEVLIVAESCHSRELVLLGHLIGVISKSWRGDWLGAQAHAAEIHARYDASRDIAWIPAITNDFKQAADLYAVYWRWMLGYPDQAVTLSDAKDLEARRLNYPFILCFSLTFGALGFYFRGDASALEVRASEAIALAREFRLPLYSDALGPINQGLAALLKGRTEEGIALLTKGMATWKGIGAGIWLPALNAALAEAYAQIGDMPEAMARVDASLEQLERPGWEEHAWLSDSLRIKGKLLMQRHDLTGAQEWLQRSLEVARTQQAKSLELRAATALAELWLQQGKTHEARDLLAPIYHWFTEGFDTRDLIAAKALLDKLS